jgi:hypothetical protein
MTPPNRLFACSYSAEKHVTHSQTARSEGVTVVRAASPEEAEAACLSAAKTRFKAAEGFTAHHAVAVQVPDEVVLAAAATLAAALAPKPCCRLAV